jgi:hypothetical protein
MGLQAIAFAAITNKSMIQSPVPIHATASAGLAVSFTTTTSSVCTASGPNGAMITFIRSGISSADGLGLAKRVVDRDHPDPTMAVAAWRPPPHGINTVRSPRQADPSGATHPAATITG